MAENEIILRTKLPVSDVILRLQKKLLNPARPLPLRVYLPWSHYNYFFGEVDRNNFWMAPAIPRHLKYKNPTVVLQGEIYAREDGAGVTVTFEGSDTGMKWPQRLFMISLGVVLVSLVWGGVSAANEHLHPAFIIPLLMVFVIFMWRSSARQMREDALKFLRNALEVPVH